VLAKPQTKPARMTRAACAARVLVATAAFACAGGALGYLIYRLGDEEDRCPDVVTDEKLLRGMFRGR